MVLPTSLSDRDLPLPWARVFLDEHLNARCGAFKDKSEYDDFYTVGRLIVDGPDRSPGSKSRATVQVDGGSGISSHVIAKFDY